MSKPTTSKAARKTPTGASKIGAPSQPKQTSRKGKKAWRKNVNLEEVEEGLEEARHEERVVGKPLTKTKDSDLFEIDVKGDDTIKSRMPRFSSSQLTSAKILAQRSAVPAVLPRATAQKRKSGVSYEDKSRLLRAGKRLRRGPLNSYVDPTELGQGSASTEVSNAAKKSGGYDAWTDEVSDSDAEERFADNPEQVKKRKVRAPVHHHPKDDMKVPAIHEPHQGTSYNPPVNAHQELLLKAHQTEERRLQEDAKLAEVKNKMHSSTTITVDGLPSGMLLETPVEMLESDDEVDEEEDGGSAPAKRPQRKTKQQRNKAEKRRAEKRLLADKAAQKRQNVHLNSMKSLRLSVEERLALRAKVLESRKAAVRQKLLQGIAGKRVGKHKVPEREVEVQLGEDLSENLRTLKPEGNLFKDRFVSMQERALIEPRVRVLPSKRRTRDVVYEKHAWKRFA